MELHPGAARERSARGGGAHPRAPAEDITRAGGARGMGKGRDVGWRARDGRVGRRWKVAAAADGEQMGAALHNGSGRK
jgi:hypothetical protein